MCINRSVKKLLLLKVYPNIHCLDKTKQANAASCSITLVVDKIKVHLLKWFQPVVSLEPEAYQTCNY